MSSAQTHRPPSATRAATRATKSAASARRLLGRARRVVDRAVVGPRVVVARGAVVVVAVGGVRRVAARRPHEVDRRPVDRHEQRPRLGGQRAQVAGVAGAEDVGEVDARRVHAGLLQHACSHGACAHSGSQKPPCQPSPKRARCDVDAGADLQAQAGVGGQQRQDRVRRRAGPRRERREGGQEVVRQALERRAAYSPAARSSSAATARVARRLDVERVRRGPHVAQEGPAALESARRLELVAQHRRQRERHRRARVAARRAAAGRRWRSPPTATPRRTATSRSPPRREDASAGRWRGGRAHGRSTATKSSARSRSRSAAQGEVARGDRGHEAVVERLGQPQRGVDRSHPRAAPARATRSARAWNSPWSSTEPKCASHSARNSSARYSRRCHGLPERSAPAAPA